MAQLVLIILFASLFCVKCESTCATYDHCFDANNDFTYSDGNVWISVNNTEQTCAECICMETKEYTISCVELEVISKTQGEKLRRNMLVSTADKKHASSNKEEDDAYAQMYQLEVELSEEEAFQIKCSKGTIPEFDPLLQEIVVRHKHYYFVTRIMYCCKKSSVYKVIHPECKVVFDDLCDSQVVNKKMPTKSCNKPFELVID